ncbi:MAG: transposase [Planctomycetaceae bacterium]
MAACSRRCPAWPGRSGRMPKHRAVKMHVAFGVFEQAPLEVAVTHGNGAEREQLRNMVQPGGFYVADRGYANNAMFREFDAQNVRFLIRVQENTTFEVQAEQPLSDADSQAGVVRDVLVRRLGTEKHNRLLEEPLADCRNPRHRTRSGLDSGDQRPRFARGTHCGCVPLSLANRTVFPLAEMRTGLPTPAESLRIGRDAAGVRRRHRVSAD